MPIKVDQSLSTRERIVVAAVQLFAQRGYRATTVGEIEAAAGLTPRSGGLYKHFGSKKEVLEAALDHHVGTVEAMRSVMDFMPLGDLRAELTLLARWTLLELAKQHDLWQILERESQEFPGLVARKNAAVQRGYREVAEFIRRRNQDLGLGEQDCEALAVIGLGALVKYRADQISLGEPPAGVDEERLVKAWVDLWITFARAARARSPRESQTGQLPPAPVLPLTPKEGGRAARRRDRG